MVAVQLVAEHTHRKPLVFVQHLAAIGIQLVVVAVPFDLAVVAADGTLVAAVVVALAVD